MSDIPSNLKFLSSHEWALQTDNGHIRVGISDHAQDQLGDLVFVELPEVGTHVDAGEDVAVVESVKSASDINAPVAGEIVAVNENLEDEPERVNQDAYGEGWLFEIKPDDANALNGLMSADEYARMLEDE